MPAYFQVENETIKELSLYIVLILLSCNRLRSYSCTVGFALKLFAVLETQKDPDVQRNTLDILCNLMNPKEEVWDTLPPADIKYPKLLLCYLIHEFKEMQVLTMRLLEQLTQYQCSNFHQIMIEAKVVEKMLDMLQAKQRTAVFFEITDLAISRKNRRNSYMKVQKTLQGT